MSVLRYCCFRWLVYDRALVFKPSRPLACNMMLVWIFFICRFVLWYLPVSPWSWSYTFACMISVRFRGRHNAGDRTAHKVLQSGFYLPTLFKDAHKFILSCDECKIIGNIGKRQEMPMNYSLVIKPFDVWGFDYMGPFPSSNGYTHILVAVDYVTKW